MTLLAVYISVFAALAWAMWWCDELGLSRRGDWKTILELLVWPVSVVVGTVRRVHEDRRLYGARAKRRAERAGIEEKTASRKPERGPR